MAAWFCACIPYLRNINSDESNIRPEYPLDHHAAFVNNWLDAMCRCRMDILCFEPVRQGPNQSDKEDKKDWLFEEVLITFFLPFLLGNWAGVPSTIIARYMRGLLFFPSPISQILCYFSIIYCDRSHLSTVCVTFFLERFTPIPAEKNKHLKT